jgi:hypothetical protein
MPKQILPHHPWIEWSILNSLEFIFPNENLEARMPDQAIRAGQTFTSSDEAIMVKVLRVGSSKEKARFKVENLRTEKAGYAITVKRKSAEPDRIAYKTDDHGLTEYELSADETVGIEITRDPS